MHEEQEERLDGIAQREGEGRLEGLERGLELQGDVSVFGERLEHGEVILVPVGERPQGGLDAVGRGGGARGDLLEDAELAHELVVEVGDVSQASADLGEIVLGALGLGLGHEVQLEIAVAHAEGVVHIMDGGLDAPLHEPHTQRVKRVEQLECGGAHGLVGMGVTNGLGRSDLGGDFGSQSGVRNTTERMGKRWSTTHIYSTYYQG